MKTQSISVALAILFAFTLRFGHAQGTAINPSGAAADNSSMLDVSAANKGILIPRIALTDTSDATTIPLPATSLLLYNTASGNGLVPGYYYNAGLPSSPRWKQLLPNPSNSSLDMVNFKITNLATCTQNLDAANKAYVDAQIAQVGGSGGNAVPTMMSSESPSAMNFIAACEYCRTLTENGFTDWYLPSFREMVQVLSGSATAVPNNTSANYFWLADYDTQYYDYIKMFRFSSASLSVTPASSNYFVRCVR